MSKQKVETAHFAIGLIVTVRRGAKPIGWGDDPFPENVPVRQSITAVAGPSSVVPQQFPVIDPHGSFEIGGWFWHPRDFYVGMDEH